jgi:hypothetical protein
MAAPAGRRVRKAVDEIRAEAAGSATDADDHYPSSHPRLTTAERTPIANESAAAVRRI